MTESRANRLFPSRIRDTMSSGFRDSCLIRVTKQRKKAKCLPSTGWKYDNRPTCRSCTYSSLNSARHLSDSQPSFTPRFFFHSRVGESTCKWIEKWILFITRTNNKMRTLIRTIESCVYKISILQYALLLSLTIFELTSLIKHKKIDPVFANIYFTSTEKIISEKIFGN